MGQIKSASYAAMIFLGALLALSGCKKTIEIPAIPIKVINQQKLFDVQGPKKPQLYLRNGADVSYDKAINTVNGFVDTVRVGGKKISLFTDAEYLADAQLVKPSTAYLSNYNQALSISDADLTFYLYGAKFSAPKQYNTAVRVEYSQEQSGFVLARWTNSAFPSVTIAKVLIVNGAPDITKAAWAAYWTAKYQ